MSADPTTLLTVREVAERLRISRSAAYALIGQGDLPCCRVGKNRNCLRVVASDLEEYVAAGRITRNSVPPSPGRSRLKHLRV